ncbi:MAG TPA: hypothetical protein VGV12_11590 [Gemmatimonadales bacterium]|nr:hypothetical protein [Gemmatimonadales bacterium]
MSRIALATYKQLPNLNDDDRLLVAALSKLGISAVPAVWDSADVCWDDYQAVVVRSCWDYHRLLPEFLAWIARLERDSLALWNPPALLRWNSHKSYLRDLAARGVPIVPTRWLERGHSFELSELLQQEAWPEAVVKPAVSASAFGAWSTTLAGAAASQPRLEALLEAGDVLVQPFMPEVRDAGEWSLMFFAGRFSHAVLKRPAAGDYRVQWEFGGSAETRTATRELIEDAERVLAAVPRGEGEPLYARVDGVARDGRLVLMELELIEPHLFLAWDTGAPGRLAAGLHHALAPA